MSRKTKAFLIWSLTPYFVAVATFTAVQSSVEGHFALRLLMAWQLHAFMLVPAAAVAMIGVPILWSLPRAKPLLTVSAGLIISLGLIAAGSAFGMTFYGGFERNIGWIWGAIMLSVPSACGGVVAGWLCSKDSPPQEEWWPGPRS